MKQTINFSQFCDAFEIRKDNFSYDGKRALFDYMERLDEDCGVESELDVIALCCEFTEYENLAELQENYTDIESMDDLTNNTAVIPIDDDSFIIQDF